MTPPQEPSILGGITTTVTDKTVSTQDSSLVPDSARPSSSTPVKQEGTAAQILQVSAEVYVVTEPECSAADASESPLQALSCMSLGTQVTSDLPYQRDPSLSPPRSTEDDIRLCLDLDPAKPVAELIGQMCAQLSPSRGLILGGVSVAPLSNDDVIVLGQWINQMGLKNLPLVQPKQVTCSGVRGLIQVLQGVKIHLIQPEDDDSATSDMDTSKPSLPPGYSGTNPSGLDLKGPTDLEEGEISDHSSLPEPMDQADTLGHGTYSVGGIASDTGPATGRISDFQSEDMDTTEQRSQIERYSDP